MITGKIIKQSDLEKRNDNNHYHIAPFRFEYLEEGKITKLILDEKFYNTRIKESKAEDNIRTCFSDIMIEIHQDILFGNNKYPEFIWDAFYKIYNIMMDWYSPINWHMYLGYHFERLEIDKKYYEILEEISKLQMYGRNYQNLLNDPILDPLKEQINQIIKKICDSSSNGVFVKTDRHSTKHDYPIQECFNGNDVIEHIFGGITAIRELKNHDNLALYFKKWKTNIGGENEFRGFIDDGKIIGISQQFLYEVYVSMKYHIENRNEIYQAIQLEWNRIYNLLDNKHKYREAIIDFYVEYDVNDVIKVWIIEINTIGKWGPAGSSLYKWIDDPPLAENLEFRITE